MKGEPTVFDALIVFTLTLAWILYANVLNDASPAFMILFSVSLVALPLALSIRRKYSLLRVFSISKPGVKNLTGGVILWAGSYVGINGFLAFLAEFFPELLRDATKNLPLLREGPLWLTLLSVALFPAVCEELLCRGFILSSLRSQAGKWPTLLLSSLLFSIMHFDPLRLPFVFILGVALAWAVWETGSLFVSILMHLLHNGTIVLISALGPALDEAGAARLLDPPAPDGLGVFALIAFTAPIGFLLVMAGARIIRKKENKGGNIEDVVSIP